MENYKAHIFSILQTFAAFFIFGVASVIVTGGTVEWTGAFWVSALIAAFRQAVKLTWERLMPKVLGGKGR